MGKDDTYVSEINFTAFVLTLSSSAWVSLGKIADPMSGEVKKDLQGAKFTIDALLMLREKTRGNLSEDEQKVLNGIISDLQTNYAETFFAEASEASEDKAEESKVEAEKTEENTAETGKTERSKTKESKAEKEDESTSSKQKDS